MTNGRPSINEWLMDMARHVAQRSNWPGMKVGCVVIREGRIVSTGYNGTPRGWHNNLSKEHKPFYCHAEENAIVNAARFGISLDGCEFYLTISPCITCARMMVNVGASAIFYQELWDGHSAELTKMFNDLQVPFRMVRDGQ